MSALQPTIKLAAALLIALFVCLSAHANSFSHPAVDRLLQSSEMPDGVVIEVVSWDPNAWQWAAPMIKQMRQQLNERFPGIDIAVVSHGGEQFQLTRAKLAKSPDLLAGLVELDDQGVDFHVCGTHSEWNNVAETEYVDLINVSPSGPAQINDYRNLGYELIVLRSPNG